MKLIDLRVRMGKKKKVQVFDNGKYTKLPSVIFLISLPNQVGNELIEANFIGFFNFVGF